MKNYPYERSFYYRSKQEERDSMERSIWLIKEIRQFESTDELIFDYLKVISKKEEHISLLQRMIESERIHYNILKDINYQLIGKVPDVDAPTFEVPDSFEEGLSEILLRKSNTIHLYVQLLNNLSPAFTSSIFPIIVEEQTHMQLLNYMHSDTCCSKQHIHNHSKDI
ncbi:ferritin-like domain-containing protein [Evansella sp. AB-rgal1]|uniref:ferritin-like domain-containing protein n=1 Tax=Evansella sp. AB-rgal1 TaxID=3242696 RepID=UPI00359EC732